jgi:hypothetical protein
MKVVDMPIWLELASNYDHYAKTTLIFLENAHNNMLGGVALSTD